MNNIVLLGSPGSGKGTISSFLVKNFGFYQVSTGDLLREISSSSSELASRIKAILNNGQLVSDEIVAEILEEKIIEFIKKEVTGFIFDGYPRTLQQAKILDDILIKHSSKITNVIELDITLNQLEERILNRYLCANCGEIYNHIFKPTKVENVCDKCNSTNFVTRSDDKKEVLEHRYKTYHKNITSIKDYYFQKGLYQKIDATLTVQEIQNRVKEILEL